MSFYEGMEIMKLSISNIAWDKSLDEKVYSLIKKSGYSAIEIAPTRIFPDKPYENLTAANAWSERLKKQYGLTVCSMQSIWYGRSEKLFGTDKERELLAEYTNKAIYFAEAIGCKNLVFGCPKNRYLPDNKSEEIAIEFFKTIGNYALSKGVSINMEANPPIYNTNYINTTQSAFDLVKAVDCEGFNINLDLGTMIENNESIDILKNDCKYIKHIHLSEPNLKPIIERNIHKELVEFLSNVGYDGYVSIEMGKQEDISIVEAIIKYVGDLF